MKNRQALASKKRFLRIMPLVFITYSLAYFDRANYSFGAAGGLSTDLGITAGVASFISALFFLGYFFFQIPGAHYAEKRSAKKLIFWCLIIWGLLASATGLVPTASWLFPIRFFLGVVESAVMPAMLVFLSNWFLKEERSRANTILILGNPVTVLWMSIVSGYLLEGLGWREMFVIEGLPSVIWAFIWWKLISNKPSEAKWLSEEEKKALDTALIEEQKGMPQVRGYKEAFKNKVVVLLSAQYFAWSIGVYGFVMWLPSIIKESSVVGNVGTGWLASIPYLLATIAMLAVSYFSDKTMNRKIFVWSALLIATIAFYSSYAVGTSNFWVSFALLVIAGGAMYAPYGPFFAIIPEILPKNVAGGANALINSMGALGSFVGAYIVGFLNGVTGNANASYIFMSISLLVAVVLTLFVQTKKQSFKQQPQTTESEVPVD